MKKTILLLSGILALSATMFAQASIPVGTVIPVELNSSIDAKKAKQGQVVIAKVAQDVPLYNGSKIKAGSRVTGEILTVTPAQGSQPASVSLRFDKVEVGGQATPVVTALRALASPLDVEAAQTQISGDDRGSTPAWSQTVTLVGGDVAYREAGVVDSGEEQVGQTVFAGNWGVLSPVVAADNCTGAIGGNNQPQALWVFSHDACGAYGNEVVISHAGRKNPEGTIILTSQDRDLKVRSGSAMLLRVHASGNQSAQAGE